MWWAVQDSNLRRRKPPDLQSGVIDHSTNRPRRRSWDTLRALLRRNAPVSMLFLISQKPVLAAYGGCAPNFCDWFQGNSKICDFGA